jgi:hypothetical protein
VADFASGHLALRPDGSVTVKFTGTASTYPFQASSHACRSFELPEVTANSAGDSGSDLVFCRWPGGVLATYFKVSGIAAPMSSKACRWALVGSASIAMVTWVPVYRTWLRVSVARCSSRPRKLW